MPIRSFDFFAKQNGAVNVQPLDLLRKTRIGIDAPLFIRKVLAKLKEPYLNALGSSLPQTFAITVEKELLNYSSNEIQLYFVLPGLTNYQSRKISFEDRRPGLREKAWDSYEKSDLDAALALWNSCGSVPHSELYPTLIDILYRNSVEFLRAPYASTAQLSYLDSSSNGYLHAVYASNDYLIFNQTDRVIIDINFESQEFTFIDKVLLLQKYQLSPDLFMDCCLLVGFDLLPTFPSLLVIKPFSFQSAIDMVKQFGSGLYACSSNEEYKIDFMRVKMLMTFHLVLTEEGIMAPLPSPYMMPPSDLHDIIGLRLPDIMYFYLSRGWISPSVMVTLTSGTLLENHPQCDGNLEEYKIFVTSPYLQNLRAVALALLSNSLPGFYKELSVATYFWFFPENPQQIPNGFTVQKKYLNSLWRTQKIISGVSKEDACSISYLLNLMKTAKNPENTFSQKSYGEYWEKYDINLVISACILQALDVRGFLDRFTHEVNSIGEALLKGVSSVITGADKDYYMELTWLVLELFQSKVCMKLEGYNPSFDLGKEANQSENGKLKWFLSRLACLIPLEFKPGECWKGEVSRDLLNFVVSAKILHKSIRNLMEMSFLRHLIFVKYSGESMCAPPKIPFESDLSTASGAVMSKFINHIFSGHSADDSGKLVEELFKDYCINVTSILAKVFTLWRCVYQTLVAMPNTSILEGDISEFRDFMIASNDRVGTFSI